MAHAGPSGINAASSVAQGQPGSAGPYPPFSVQRRAQLAQQGLGGMGGMRPPGKTGLSFDVILSRLQGELQKSKQTGHELDTLTGAMHVIQDTLGGSLVGFFIIFSLTILTPIHHPSLVLFLPFLQIYLPCGHIRKCRNNPLLPLPMSQRVTLSQHHHPLLHPQNNLQPHFLRPLLQLPSSIFNLNFEIPNPLSLPILTR